jgi:hypothetical protein
MDDAGAGRNHTEVVKCLLAPAQERVALAVALVLALDVVLERHARAELVDLHGMIDHQLGGLERIDARGVAAHAFHRIAHRGQIDDGRNAREVLQQHARGRKVDLAARQRLRFPAGECLDVFLRIRQACLVAEHVLQEDPQRERQSADVEALLLERVEPEHLEAAAADAKRRAGTE